MPIALVPHKLCLPTLNHHQTLKLTLPDDNLLLVMGYTNQNYKRYCHDHPRNFAVRRFDEYSFKFVYLLQLEHKNVINNPYLISIIPNSYHISNSLCQEIDCYYWLNSVASTMQTPEMTEETTDLDIFENTGSFSTTNAENSVDQVLMLQLMRCYRSFVHVADFASIYLKNQKTREVWYQVLDFSRC